MVGSEVKIMEMFPDPHDVGQMEYRAIYDHIRDVLRDCPEEERVDLCRGMLEEFVMHAQSMLETLKDAKV